MKTTQLENIPPGHLRISLGINVFVMYPKLPPDEQPYLIICNPKTGERLQVDLTEDVHQPEDPRDVLLEQATQEMNLGAACINEQRVLIEKLSAVVKMVNTDISGGFRN